MSTRLILWNNDVEVIKGAATAEGFAGQVEVASLSFAANNRFASDREVAEKGKPMPGQGKADADQTAITLSLPFGPWVADFQQRLFHGKTLGTVTLTEVEQKVDGGKKTWKKIREIKLTEAWMESMSHSWNGNDSTVSIKVNYVGSTFGYDDAVASFSRSAK